MEHQLLEQEWASGLLQEGALAMLLLMPGLLLACETAVGPRSRPILVWTRTLSPTHPTSLPRFALPRG